ncbi:U6 snRNA-associated Sm-like protein LSm4 [Drosophila obscura]|uniref:U6 snRNA-associated Sm-like protein LSm4 n=1 Tax=Drosophila obscura TaxID=7282 RepID=UPI000BA01EBC|nr:U6 snRNA-associated Sm-like protein LSm4 [Drosophila obscura]
MLPLSLLKTAQSHPMLVELKNGETYNGHLVSCDSWMNINLRDVICTSKDGDRFWRMPECYIRGSTIKYLRIPDEVIDMVKEDAQAKSRNRTELNKNRVANSAQNQRSARNCNRNNFGNRSGQLCGGSGNSTLRVGVAGQGNRLLAQSNKNRK